MMTKQEERSTLEKIAKLIAAAGEDSYIGMAFAGCVEMAKSNIENDFGNSMQDALITARENANREHEMRIRAQDELERLNAIIAKHNGEVAALKQQIKAEKAKQIPYELYRDIYLVLDSQTSQANAEIENTVAILAACADKPGDIAVANGLRRLKLLTQRKDDANRLMNELDKYEPKN